jgi:hypothetical protein
MALLWIDGFEGYGVTGTTNIFFGSRGYTFGGSGGARIVTGRIGGYAAAIYNSIGYMQTKIFTTTDPTLIVGCALRWQSAANGSHTLSFYSSGTLGINASLYSDSVDGLVIKLGADVISTTPLALLNDTWYYVEMKVKCDSTVGTVEIRINNTSVLSLTGINTKAGANAYHNCFRWLPTNVTNDQIDDLYICDGSDSTQNDFLGICHIVGLFPTGDTATVQWGCSTGTSHFALVDENPISTADYVASVTSGSVDLYTYPTLTGSGSIVAVQVSSAALIYSGSSVILQSPIVSNSVTDYGPDNQITSGTVAEVQHISLTDPNTGEAWTVSGLGAASIGIKVV